MRTFKVINAATGALLVSGSARQVDAWWDNPNNGFAYDGAANRLADVKPELLDAVQFRRDDTVDFVLPRK